MTEFNSVAPCFPVADISATIRWYEEQLGFIGNPFPAAEPYVFAILRRDDVEIMLQEWMVMKSRTSITRARVACGMPTFASRV